MQLQDLLISPQKNNLAAFLAAAPLRSYSVQELATRLRMPAATLNRLAKELASGGLAKISRKGNSSFIQLNNKNKFAVDLKNQLAKSKIKYEDELVSAIRRLGQIKAAVLSGIFSGQPQLPVDLLIVGKVNLTKLDTFLQNCRKMTGQEINYSIMSEQEFVLRRDTFDRFIKDIFDYPHLTVLDNTQPAERQPYE